MTEGSKNAGRVARILIVIALAVTVAGVMVAKNASRSAPPTVDAKEESSASGAEMEQNTHARGPTASGLPRLVDLGSHTCIPCKMMKPILEELSEEYAESFETTFIDVNENEDAKDDYGIRLIPTQIFYDAQGKELFRHEGFFSKEDILAKWREFGVIPAEEE